MNTKTIKLAIIALKKQAQPLAFDANLYEEGVNDTPHAENSYKQRREIFTAIADLEAYLRKNCEVK